MGICSVPNCHLHATFDSPHDLCDEHWIDWWMEDYEQDGYTQEELAQIREECRDNIQKRAEKSDNELDKKCRDAALVSRKNV